MAETDTGVDRRAQFDRERARSRAEVLCAMDCIMHHLNDEEDITGWLSEGVPDGGPFDVLDEEGGPKSQYYGQFVDDFEAMVEVFARTIRRVCFNTKYAPAGFS